MFQVYIIEVTDGQHKWTVKHRYSDFHDLHEKVSEWFYFHLNAQHSQKCEGKRGDRESNVGVRGSFQLEQRPFQAQLLLPVYVEFSAVGSFVFAGTLVASILQKQTN